MNIVIKIFHTKRNSAIFFTTFFCISLHEFHKVITRSDQTLDMEKFKHQFPSFKISICTSYSQWKITINISIKIVTRSSTSSKRLYYNTYIQVLVWTICNQKFIHLLKSFFESLLLSLKEETSIRVFISTEYSKTVIATEWDESSKTFWRFFPGISAIFR